jgi:hypothetical protein
VGVARVRERRFVLPEPLAGLRRSGVEAFCKEAFPGQVRHWPDWIKDDAKAATKARITALVDSAERLEARPRPETHGQREIVRLGKGSDALEVDWETSRTEVHLRGHAAATFEVYATIAAKWNGQDVLDVRMGGDGKPEGARWHIIAVKKYQTGAWADLIRRMNMFKDSPAAA